MPKPKTPSVADFISATSQNKWCSGPKCGTCSLPNRDAIETATREFLTAREAGKTTMPFRTFVRLYLRPSLKYPHDHRALQHHWEKCLGEEVQ